MRKFKVAQILSSRAVKRNYLHCKLKQYTVSELAKVQCSVVNTTLKNRKHTTVLIDVLIRDSLAFSSRCQLLNQTIKYVCPLPGLIQLSIT